VSYQIRLELSWCCSFSPSAPHRFRWAVCQVDCLRRLKQDESAIENALKNLPEKLEDVYIRIFELIPTEDWPIVRHTLRWIYFHGEIFDGQPMSIFTIIKAFESTECDPIAKNRFYDESGIKDVCGCLIKISTDVDFGISIDGIMRQSASYAHYTVCEFLESDRILHGPTSYFELSYNSVLAELFETALSHATNKLAPRTGNRDEPDAEDDDDSGPERGELDFQWRDFAFISAMLGLYSLPFDVILTSGGARWNQLLQLIGARINPPFSRRDGKIEKVVYSLLTSSHAYPGAIMDLESLAGTSKYWEAVTKLLFVSEARGEFSLATRILECSTPGDLAHQDIYFEFLYAQHESDFDDERTYLFAGSPAEIFSQLWRHFPKSFEFLLNQPKLRHNPTFLLLSHLGVHKTIRRQYGMCPSCPALSRRLIDCGASVNGQGYQITPLQIAASNVDGDAIELLLAHEADPNGVGDADGISWGESSVLHRYQALSGIPPLECLRIDHEDLEFDEDEVELPEFMKRPMMSLLNHGARITDSGFKVTLLQIAVFYLEVDLVESLLKSGADPNGRGNPEGDNSHLSNYWGFLDGKTPLECCQHDEYGVKDLYGDKIGMLEALLRARGAIGPEVEFKLMDAESDPPDSSEEEGNAEFGECDDTLPLGSGESRPSKRVKFIR
jgi:hypothetical protein